MISCVLLRNSTGGDPVSRNCGPIPNQKAQEKRGTHRICTNIWQGSAEVGQGREWGNWFLRQVSNDPEEQEEIPHAATVAPSQPEGPGEERQAATRRAWETRAGKK